MNKSKFEFELFEYKVRSNNCLAQCEVKFIPRPDYYDLVVIVKELPDNPGMSVCKGFEDLFSQLAIAAKLPLDSIKWVEYWPASSGREEEEYCQVHYELSYGKATLPRWRYLGNSETAALEAIL